MDATPNGEETNKADETSSQEIKDGVDVGDNKDTSPSLGNPSPPQDDQQKSTELTVNNSTEDSANNGENKIKSSGVDDSRESVAETVSKADSTEDGTKRPDDGLKPLDNEEHAAANGTESFENSSNATSKDGLKTQDSISMKSSVSDDLKTPDSETVSKDSAEDGTKTPHSSPDLPIKDGAKPTDDNEKHSAEDDKENVKDSSNNSAEGALTTRDDILNESNEDDTKPSDDSPSNHKENSSKPTDKSPKQSSEGLSKATDSNVEGSEKSSDNGPKTPDSSSNKCTEVSTNELDDNSKTTTENDISKSSEDSVITPDKSTKDALEDKSKASSKNGPKEHSNTTQDDTQDSTRTPSGKSKEVTFKETDDSNEITSKEDFKVGSKAHDDRVIESTEEGTETTNDNEDDVKLTKDNFGEVKENGTGANDHSSKDSKSGEYHDNKVSKETENRKQATYSATAEGQGLHEAMAEIEAQFTVTVKSTWNGESNSDSSEYKPTVVIKSQHVSDHIETMIVDNKDGTFSITYLITQAAEYEIEIKVQEKEISGSPFKLNVIPFDISTSAEVHGLQSEILLGSEGKFEVKLRQTKGKNNLLPEVKFEPLGGGDILRPLSVDDNQDGSFTVSYIISEECEYSIKVQIQGKDIHGSPFKIKASSPAKFSTAEGNGLKYALVGAEGNFAVTTRGADGNAVYCPHSSPQVYITYPGENAPEQIAKLDNNEDGSYLVRYVLTEEKIHKVEIKIDNVEIPGSPFDLDVKMQQFNPLFEFGREGDGEGEFQKPWGVAVNSAGEIIVTDRVRNNIQVFTSNGKYLKTIGKEGSAEGELRQPTGVVCDKGDNIIVADTKNHRIQVFTKDGSFLRCFGTKGSGRGKLHTPLDLSLAVNGNIIVTDYGNQRVQVFSSEGKFVLKFCDRPEGKLDHPIDCVLLDDQYYVSEEDEACIKIYNKRGRFLYSFGCQGSLNGEFDRPFGLTVDKFNRLVVTDSCNDRVQLFTKEGVFAGKFGKRGRDLGCLKGPSAIEVMKDGKYVVTDSRNKRIQVFE